MRETLSEIQPAQHTQDTARDDEHICRNGDHGKEWPWGKDVLVHCQQTIEGQPSRLNGGS